MRKITIGLALLLAISLCSCGDDDPAGPAESTPFTLRLAITDQDTNPAPNLRVSGWNYLSFSVPGKSPGSFSESFMPAATSWHFEIPVACYIELIIYDTEGALVDTFYTMYGPAGAYQAYWALGSCLIPPGVYEIELTASDTLSDSLIFADSILAVYHSLDPENTVLGFADADGIFETNDSICFPSLYTLPDLQRTDETGYSLGTFSYVDGIRIVVTDTVTDEFQVYDMVLSHGLNDFDLTWNPAGKIANANDTIGRTPAMTITKSNLKEPPPPTEFRLYQNYPNPFN